MENKTEKTSITTHTIDASGKRLGRVASEAASYLMGKNLTDFARNRVPTVSVRIENASKMNIVEAKRGTKLYHHHSGYPGGMKEETLEHLAERRGYRLVLEHAIYGMLPGNRLRAVMMKKLVITE